MQTLTQLYKQLEKSRNIVTVHNLIIEETQKEINKVFTTKEKSKGVIYRPFFNENSIMGIIARAIKNGDYEATKQFII